MGIERRKYGRYDTDAKVYFSVTYVLDTKMKFQVIDKDKHTAPVYDRHIAHGKDISLEGFSFTSDQKLNKGDRLYLEVYIDEKKEPIRMEGEVRWSEKVYPDRKYEDKFNTGLKLLTVEGRSVLESIHYDEKNRVTWSVVLDSIFGSHRRIVQRQDKS